MNKLAILDIVEWTTADGPGFRTAIYSAGCTFHCNGCHNPSSWNIEQGKQMLVDDVLEYVVKDQTDITFTGGDPLLQVEAFTDLAKKIKEKTQKNIWCYTGHLFEEVKRSPRLSSILPYIDIMVDGVFVQDCKDDQLLFRGSSNQRMVDVQQSLANNQVVLLPNEPIF